MFEKLDNESISFKEFKLIEDAKRYNLRMLQKSAEQLYYSKEAAQKVADKLIEFLLKDYDALLRDCEIIVEEILVDNKTCYKIGQKYLDEASNG